MQLVDFYNGVVMAHNGAARDNIEYSHYFVDALYARFY
jgi:hypothetical protein